MLLKNKLIIDRTIATFYRIENNQLGMCFSCKYQKDARCFRIYLKSGRGDEKNLRRICSSKKYNTILYKYRNALPASKAKYKYVIK
jgi:hypothetical protein